MSAIWISFLSDYGFDDACVGVCHGVIARKAPHARVIDVCHAISPQDVEHGAIMLAGAVGYLPAGIRLALVEPLEAGGFTRGVAVRTADGSVYIAPDNGLTSLAWEISGGVVEAYEIANAELWLPLPTAVFRGRDVYAPVAARLAAGLDLAEVGPPLSVETLCRLRPRACRLDGDHLHAEVVYVDHFGNAALNVVRSDLEAIGVLLGDHVEVRTTGRSVRLPFSPTYGDVPAGATVLCEDSLRRIIIAVNCGRAVDTLRLRRRDAVVVSQIARRPATSAVGERFSLSV